MRLALACVVLACYVPGTAAEQSASSQPPSSKDARFFERRVAPILKRRCIPCHNQELKDGGISFLDRDSLLKGGSRGPAVVPGDPERSVLVRAIRHNSEPQMPPGPKLPGKEITTLISWIRRGAPWVKLVVAPAR